MHEGDGLPNLMCVQCVLQCSRAYTFKQLCEKSDNILRQYLSVEFQAQLAQVQTVSAEQRAKTELQEQLQFADTMPTVVIETGAELQTDDFINVTYSGETVKNEIFEIETELHNTQNETEFHVEEEEEEETREELKTDIGNNKLKYPCPKCDESFSLKVDLKVHMMSHPKDLDHVCHVCQKGFPEARILKRHLKIHLDKKPHQCDQCDMSFAESSNLSKHKKKHTGELRNILGKPHLCSVCGRAFKWASSLSKHMKYHTGHKLLTCEHCNKQYVEVS